ncbi:MAG TPA: efflux RND transporter periplasmic adaptor subunit [Isosphaeraceae bacterium]|nr:efflux RND transporter periplasmic adaptor subunit [Isosphaeraceae bacterium]
MSSRLGSGSRRSVWLRLTMALALVAAAWVVTGFVPERTRSLPSDAIEWAVARRVDLDTKILAGGDLQAARETSVACQVEDIPDADGTLILSLIDNGTLVKKGDVLCRLDSSQFEELARQQEIAAGQARALYLQAKLVLETARIALREYQEGQVTRLTKEFEGRIALEQSATQRQVDRLAWTEHMLAKGYLSRSQLLSERQALARARHELVQAEGEFHVFQRFQVPKEVRTLGSQIQTAEIDYRVAADRLKAEEDRLAHLRKQIANCTVRAPQAGLAINADKDRWWWPPLRPGDRVYQGEEMFLIPDLTQMEAQVSVHESMGPRVRVGMKADVRIAAMPGRVFPGRVTAIDQLPSVKWKEWDENLKHYIVRVRLDQAPAGVRPFMSAEVEIDTGRVPDALVIPVEAMTVVDGRQSCYVVVPEGLERRTVTTRRSTTDLLEVTGGLAEGERVALRAPDVRGIPVDEPTEDPPGSPPIERTAAPSRSKSPERATARES